MATKSKKQQVIIEGADVQDEYHALIAVWLLRMLLSSASAFKGFFVNKRGFMDSDLQEFLQLSDDNDSKIKVSDLRESLRFLLVSYEKKVDSSGILFRNIALISKRIHLNIVQQHILALVVLKERYEVLKDCFERLHTPGESHLYTGLAKVLDVDVQSIAKAMAGNAALRASGLIKLDENYRTGLDLEPMDGLSEALMAENENEQALLSHFLVPAKAATLGAADYSHVCDDLDLLQGMLTASLKQ